MLRFLFPRLTRAPRRGQPLFDRVVEEARRPHWYIEGGVPDTLDGRFAMVATVCALAIVRVESSVDEPASRSAALTECFIEAMDAEHRQMGINDPTLGKKVRKMVGALARRVDLWRSATSGRSDWSEACQSSLYGTGAANDGQIDHVAKKLRELWERLAAASDETAIEGRF